MGEVILMIKAINPWFAQCVDLERSFRLDGIKFAPIDIASLTQFIDGVVPKRTHTASLY